MKHIKHSPIDNSELEPFLSCKDHTVSNNIFSILEDSNNNFLITSPRPNDSDLSNFYESEDYISHTDAKKSLFDKVYHLIRMYAIKQKVKLVSSFLKEEKSILDIGAGTGDFLLACKNKGWQVEGIEPNNKARIIAENKLQITLKESRKEITGKKYDVISMWHVLEHIPDLNELVSDLKDLLKDNGTLIIAVPNHRSFDANYYKEFWAGYDVPRHLWHFSRTAMENLFLTKGIQVKRTVPMIFDSFYVSLLSEKYKTGKTKPLKALSIGFKSNLKAKRSKEYSSLIYVLEKA